jgi:hypothetical protein
VYRLVGDRSLVCVGCGWQKQRGLKLTDGGTEASAGRRLRAALLLLSGGLPGPCWAVWPGCQMLVLLLGELQTDYSVQMVK